MFNCVSILILRDLCCVCGDNGRFLGRSSVWIGIQNPKWTWESSWPMSLVENHQKNMNLFPGDLSLGRYFGRSRDWRRKANCPYHEAVSRPSGGSPIARYWPHPGTATEHTRVMRSIVRDCLVGRPEQVREEFAASY
jgi:hypothetical protein